MANYVESANDLFGKRAKDVCGGAPVILSNNYYGMNSMEVYLR